MLLYYLKSIPTDSAFMTKDGRPVPFFGIPFDTMERAVMAVLVPVVFILVGSWIAPAQKYATAVVLGVLWLLGLSIAVTWAVSSERVGLQLTLCTYVMLALNIAGVVYAISTARRAE
ncbi:MAG: hypothetical protein AB1725_08705 [Armatimonadota bacterium]